MDLRIVSHDEGLQALCREVLSEFPGRHWHVFTHEAASAVSITEFYIWDFQADTVLPDNADQTLSNQLFLIHRNDLAILRQRLGTSEAYVLLKPVTRATLSIFLGLAVSAHEARISRGGANCQDRDEILQCLLEANLKLQELDQDRTNFLVRGLHDFRAPLTALLGYCGLLQAGALGSIDDDQKEVLRRMHHSTKRLSRMASAMFQVNVARDVRSPATPDKIGIRECIVQALHEVRPIADSKHISISVDLDSVTPLLHFDSGLMEQVLINLLENACKFTPKGGQIRIRGGPFFWERRSLACNEVPSAERRQQSCGSANAHRIDILDSGAPIPSKYLEKLFKAEISSSEATCRFGGGLGLVICRMAVEQHQGHIWAQNTVDGPVFSIILPVHPGVGQSNPPGSHTLISEVYQ
jgi:signal transduction histidine kinase